MAKIKRARTADLISWRLRVQRCECGDLIWPWQARGYDPEVGMIHLECGADDE